MRDAPVFHMSPQRTAGVDPEPGMKVAAAWSSDQEDQGRHRHVGRPAVSHLWRTCRHGHAEISAGWCSHGKPPTSAKRSLGSLGRGPAPPGCGQAGPPEEPPDGLPTDPRLARQPLTWRASHLGGALVPGGPGGPGPSVYGVDVEVGSVGPAVTTGATVVCGPEVVAPPAAEVTVLVTVSLQTCLV